jgi:hypothetical protein
MSEQQTDPALTPAPDRTPKPNQVLAQPATVAACRAELRTPAQQQTAAAAARTQQAFARINATR